MQELDNDFLNKLVKWLHHLEHSINNMTMVEIATGIVILAGFVYLFWPMNKKKKSFTISDEIDNDKVVLITGCDSGFGKLLALECTKLPGFKVVAACLTQDGAQDLLTQGIAKTVVANLMTTKGRQSVIDVTQNYCHENGNYGLYALVNNAGIAPNGMIDWVDPKSYEDCMSLNFHAPVALTHGLLLQLKRARGRVVNITSVEGILSFPTNAAYCASKHALESFSDCLRMEMMPWGVTVTVIQPSTMKTPLAMRYLDGFQKSFNEAPPDRQDEYGHAWVHEHVTKGKSDLKGAASDPMITVQDILSVLTNDSTKKVPPTRIPSGFAAKYIFKPISWLPDSMRDKILYNAVVKDNSKKEHVPLGLAVPRHCPPINKTAYVQIVVRNLAVSIGFYQNVLGCTPIGRALNGKQFLRTGENSVSKPLILLVQDENMSPRDPCYAVGVNRLCLLTDNLDKLVKDLKEKKSHHIKFMGPPTKNPGLELVALQDPDNFCIYFVRLTGVNGLVLNLQTLGQMKKHPNLFHLSISVGDYKEAHSRFEKLGYDTLFDQTRDQITYDALPSFGMDPKSSIIEHNRFAILPKDGLALTLTEWVEPRQVKDQSKKTMTNAVGISVHNVEQAMKRAKRAGWIIHQDKEGEPIVENRELPYFGTVRVGTAFLENERCNKFEFVSF